jgi:hypothetical protein
MWWPSGCRVNPVHFIIFTAESFDQIQIYGYDGQLVLTSTSSLVAISSLRSGLYIARAVAHNRIIYKGEFLKL